MNLTSTSSLVRAVPLTVAAALVVVACSGSDGDGGTRTAAMTPAAVRIAPAWPGFGGDPQHTAITQVATQELARVRWSAPVDTAPQYNEGGYLFVHYGSPAITSRNTVLFPVKRAVEELYRVEARAGSDGTLVWRMDSDYVMPAHSWTPSYNVTLTASNRVYAPGAGGKLIYRDDADSASAAPQTVAFYGNAAYTASKAAFDRSVFINTPVTADVEGNLYFGFIALAGNPGKLESGFARINAAGNGIWMPVSELAQDSAVTKPATNSAPALSTDGKTLYVAVNGSTAKGYLLALDAATLELKAKALLVDPQTQRWAAVSDDSTASPTVGPDGDVYFGVLETTYGEHNARGWLLHFDATLAKSKLPGSFGWDDTASIVPASMVPGYAGSSSYLVAIKYNNYSRVGSGDSKNKLAVLDPNASQSDFIAHVPVMKDVLTILGVTPHPQYPGGVTEWCINTQAVDPFTKSILVNSEDGYLYRWDLASNRLSERVRLTSGLGESYTPTVVGPDGTVYAINNAVLFAVGE